MMGETKKDRIQLLVRRFFLFLTDTFLLNACVYLSLIMRFDVGIVSIEPQYINNYVDNMLFYTIISLFIFWVFRLYHSLWQYASIAEVYRIAEACITVEVVHFLSNKMVGNMLPRSCYFNAAIYLIIAICASRFMYRMIRTVLNKYRNIKTSNNVMIIGAGEATNVIMREIQNSSYLANSNIACIIDDDRRKVGKYIRGVKVIGTRDKIKEAAKLYDIDEIIFAIPSASNEVKRDILNICKETDCTLKILPGVYQMVDGEINVNSIRNVDVLDLLGRDPIEVDIESIMGYVKDKVIMVTGGGGSIGSELCRQLVSHKPKQLIIFDIYENNAYDIQQELKINYPDANVVTLIGSIRNVSRLESVFAQYKPDIVYHAAAHKHVPLMEVSPDEAVKNNVVGTWNVARMADKYGVKKFVMISTDKAVNPTNVMGATKRICEMIVQTYNEISKTDFVAVRFGNVLGSNGSVIPLFKRQIEAGGPVTVTDPNIIRYFMTIPEAVSLVLQAGAYAKGGEIFILDMGEPVKIDDLAKNLIRLSGYTLGVNMEIKYTGLRPGEKLYEELLMKEEGLQETDNKLIHIGKPIEFDKENFFDNLEKLKEEAYSETGNIRELIKEVVPTYHPGEH
jgi:FlaA1/EpsC-like NDP-sugar epimerase